MHEMLIQLILSDACGEDVGSVEQPEEQNQVLLPIRTLLDRWLLEV